MWSEYFLQMQTVRERIPKWLDLTSFVPTWGSLKVRNPRLRSVESCIHLIAFLLGSITKVHDYFVALRQESWRHVATCATCSHRIFMLWEKGCFRLLCLPVCLSLFGLVKVQSLYSMETIQRCYCGGNLVRFLSCLFFVALSLCFATGQRGYVGGRPAAWHRFRVERQAPHCWFGALDPWTDQTLEKMVHFLKKSRKHYSDKQHLINITE